MPQRRKQQGRKSPMSSSTFQKNEISVVEKQIDRLRKEVDERMRSNHTLWRAGLAGIGAFILLKDALDLKRVFLALPLLCMGLAAHWLNQLVTLFRSGDALAACETRINRLAGQVLLDHEILLARMRRELLGTWHSLIIVCAATSTLLYWFVMWQVRPRSSDAPALLLWPICIIAALLVNVVSLLNLRRLLTFSWPALSGVDRALGAKPFDADRISIETEL